MSEYHQVKYRDAAESFAASTQGTLPTAEYDLQARYYVARCLEELDEPEKAAEAEAQMVNFAYGLEPLQERIGRQPDYAHLERTRADVEDIAARLDEQKTLETAES